MTSRLGSWCLLLISWVVVAFIADDSQVFPMPWLVLARMAELIQSDNLFWHIGVTLLRVLASFILAMFIGTAIGYAMGRSRWWNDWLDSVVIVLLNMPALVVIMLCFIWFGLNEMAAVLAVTVNKIPLVVVNVREGARALDERYALFAKTYRLSNVTRLHKIVWPQIYPHFLSAARNGLAMIWKIVLVVELLGRSDGVGFQMATHFHYFDISAILAYTVVFVLIIYLIDVGVLGRLQQQAGRWRSA